MDKKRIVVLGGGYAGVNAAKRLYKKLKKRKDIEIELIDKNVYHTLMTELHEVAGGRAAPASVKISYEKIFGGTHVKLVHDQIETIDFKGKKLISQRFEHPYDYLVIGAGAQPDFFDIKGANEHSLTLWSYSDALKVRDHIENQFLQASKETDPLLRKELLTFIVAGGGFTGAEIAGELLEWKKKLSAENFIDEKEVRIIIIEAMARILSILPEKLQKKASHYLTKKGCEIMTESPITEVKTDAVVMGSKEIKARTLIWTAGVQGCEFGANLALTKGKCVSRACVYLPALKGRGEKNQFAEGGEYINGKLGRLLVKDTMQSADYDEVYIAGDLVWYQEGQRVLPQVVETALQTSDAAVHNIIADIQGKPKKPFKSNYHGFMVSLGGSYGVAHLMGISSSGFIAMAMKHLINLHYLLVTAGVNAVWGYIQHHFLDVKDNRSIIGGHASFKVRIYWLVFLRLFLGIMWLVEGIGKVFGGWLDPKRIFIMPVSGSSGASEAAPAAAGTAHAAATNAVHIITNAAEAVSQASAAVSNTGGPVYSNPLLHQPLDIYLWFANHVIAQAPFVFQAFVVCSEIAIGLALLAGLFTFLASLGSIVLCTMFIVSAMASKEILWYLASAIVMLGGGGRGFGLDYWVMPWIKRWWNGTKIAKKTYFYIDEPRKKRHG